MSAAKVIHELQSRGVELYLSGDKLKVRGEESVIASILPVVRANRDEIVSQLASALPGPWSWLPEDCPYGVDWNAWDCARTLRDACKQESFSLCRRDGGFILIPTKSITPESASILKECIDYLLDAATPYLAGYAEHFPILTPKMAGKCLAMLAEHHGRQGFKVRGWYGLEYPEPWPAAVKVAVQSIYIERLFLDGSQGGPLH